MTAEATFKVPTGFFENLRNDTPITPEEGYYLTGFYVTNFIVKGQFAPLVRKCKVIDLIHDLFYEFSLPKHKDANGNRTLTFFEVYNPAITSKKYHVMHSVKMSLIDKLRRHREEVSLDLPIGDDGENTILDLIPDPRSSERQDQTEMKEVYEKILELVPDTTGSKLRGFSKQLNCEVAFTPRVVIRHFVMGMTPAEIAEIFINPVSGRPVSTSHVSQLIAEARSILRPCYDRYCHNA